jgi:chromosome segregation ATPase
MNVIAKAEAELAEAQHDVAEVYRRLYELKTARQERATRPIDPALWPSWEAEAQALEQELGQTDRELRLAHGRVVELRGAVQTAVNRVQAARGALGDAVRAVERLDEREAGLRRELAQIEAQRATTAAQADARRQELAQLLGVDVGDLEQALVELERPAEAFVLSWSRTSEPQKPVHSMPVRSEYGADGVRHFDVAGRQTDAWGAPLE